MNPEDFNLIDDLQYIGHVDSSRNCYIKLKCSPEHVNALRGLEGEIFRVSMMQIQNDGTTKDGEAPPGHLCITAVELCKDPAFQVFVESNFMVSPNYDNEENAKACILEQCKISSRKELDIKAKAAELFAELRTEFAQWKHRAQGVYQSG